MGESAGKTSTGLDQNVAGFLCYLLWWVTGIIFLILEKENRFVRFHAMQSIVTFGALFIVSLVLSFVPFVGWILWVLSVILWIFMMFKAYKGERYKLPWIGNFAEKLLNKNS